MVEIVYRVEGREMEGRKEGREGGEGREEEGREKGEKREISLQ